MSTQAQIDANRENSLLSSGPKTEAGKTASSQNRGSHFLAHNTRFRVLPNESEIDFEILVQSLQGEFQPQGFTEAALLRRMAEHEWMRQRAVHHMDRMFSCEERYANPLLPRTEKEFALMMRYHVMHERAYYAALNQLLKLRAESKKADIGFEREAQQAQRHDMQKQRHATTEKARHLDAECKIIRTLRQSANHPEALERARDVATRYQAA